MPSTDMPELEMAFDPRHPYYDAKSTRENPKWDIVYVQFVRKFADIVKLSELKTYAEPGGALGKMQMLKQGRLSVSAVAPKEWEFILDLAGEDLEDNEPGHVEDALAENVNGTNKLKAGNPINGGAAEEEENDDEGDDEDEGNVVGEDEGDEVGDGEDDVEGADYDVEGANGDENGEDM